MVWEDIMAEDWHPSLDAVAAAPEYHRVLYEDDHIRVLLVEVKPDDSEPMHHHRWPSVFVFDKIAKIKDHNASGATILDLPPAPLVALFGPQPSHSVENIDQGPIRGVRIEFKQDQLIGLVNDEKRLLHSGTEVPATG
jgi:hypothetical protein